MSRRVLLLLPQIPQDPTSGAARSMTGIVQQLAGAGFKVRSLSASAVESATPINPRVLLDSLKIRVEVDRRSAVGRGRPTMRYRSGGVDFTVLDTGEDHVREWDFKHGQQFNRMVERTLEEFRPDIVFTYGGQAGDVMRRELSRLSGAAVVFGLRNTQYMHALAFEHVDAVLTPSRYLSERYRAAIGLESTPIYPAIDPAEVTPEKHERKFFTFVNPTPGKGLFFFLRIVDELSRSRPDIGLQVVEARGKGVHVQQAAEACGLDWRAWKNLWITATVRSPRQVLSLSRAVLVPSVDAEGFGRVAAEALAAGIPAIVSDRGGLPEAVGLGSDGKPGGIVLPLAEGFVRETQKPPLLKDAQPWIDAIVRMQDDSAEYTRACERARAAATRFAPGVILGELTGFFSGVLRTDNRSARSG